VTQDSPAPVRKAGTRNASLDTLRALAIVLVVFCHATLNYGVPNGLDFMGLGGVGVDLFFCLSGWLLGRQLCEELQRTGGLEVRRFWLRRWLRTLPAYFAVLFATMAQAVLQGKLAHWWPYPVFLQNYLGMPFFGVSWSLCVEEYFYLAVAPTLLLFYRRPRLRPVVPLLLAVPLVARLATPYVALHYGWKWDLQMTHLRYDQCAAGVLLAAAAVFRPAWWRRMRQALVVWVPLGLVLAGMNFYWRIARIPHADWDPIVWTFSFAALVALANAGPFWQTRAAVPGARYLADRAYAVYLLHIEGIAVMNRAFGQQAGHPGLPLWAYLAGVWLVALVAAEVLYRTVERPFMRAREWFTASRSTHGEVAAAPARATSA
jgi:peptidoglycan/LPS O-acetylase OafA/YrhL